MAVQCLTLDVAVHSYGTHAEWILHRAIEYWWDIWEQPERSPAILDCVDKSLVKSR